MTATEPLQHVRTIYELARSVSQETRAELASDLDGGAYSDPRRKWQDLVRGRAARGVEKHVRAAGRQVVTGAGTGQLARAIRPVVRNLVRAVGELASFTPAYEQWEREEAEIGGRVTMYVPCPADVARLDELRQNVYCRLIELDELLRGHPNPLAWVCAVARRTAVKLLPTDQAGRVSRWFEQLEADNG